MWFTELGTATFTIEVGRLSFEMAVGRVGVTDKEKLAIGLFKHSDERDPRHISEIPTLNLSTSVDVELPASMDDRVIGSADAAVEPFVGPAFAALQRLIEAYRDVKYLSSRGTPQWLEQRGVFVREMPLRTFRSYLFYVLTVQGRTFVGVFAEGHSVLVMAGDTAVHDALARTLTGRVPLERVLMIRAWERFFEGDFRSAIVDAATVVELTLGKVLSAKLVAAHAGSDGRIRRFVNETSNRHLVTVVGGLLGIESEVWREGVAASLDVRHALIHGGKRQASQDEAQSAIDYAERLLILSEQVAAAQGAPQ